MASELLPTLAIFPGCQTARLYRKTANPSQQKALLRQAARSCAVPQCFKTKLRYSHFIHDFRKRFRYDIDPGPKMPKNPPKYQKRFHRANRQLYWPTLDLNHNTGVNTEYTLYLNLAACSMPAICTTPPDWR